MTWAGGGGGGEGDCWVEKSWCQWSWCEVYCLFIYFFLAIVDWAEIVNVVIWGSSLAVSCCADIFEWGLWQCSLQDVMGGALNSPCLFIAVCSCKIVFISAQKYVTILTVTLANDQLDAQIFNTFITFLYMYMFRAICCSSLGGQIVLIQHLVSSLRKQVSCLKLL
jgi:hypothetical protein